MHARRVVKRSVYGIAGYVFLGLPVPVPALLGGGEGLPCNEEFVACVVPGDKAVEGSGFTVVCLDPGPCVPFPVESTITPLVVEDLASKGLTTTVLVPDPADADPKDVLVKGVPHATGEPGRHLMMRGKQPGAAATVLYQRPLAGYFGAQIELSFEDEDGLVDGQSNAFFELRQIAPAVAEGEPLAWRLSATWDAEAPGFLVEGSDASGPVGEPALVSGPAVTLRFELTELGTTLSAQPTLAEGDAFLFTDDTPPPLTAWEGAFGVAQLDPPGTFFFDRLQLEPTLAGAGSEALAGLKALVAGQQLAAAASLASEPPAPPDPKEGLGGPSEILVLLDEALASLAEAGTALQTEEDAGTLDPTTQVALAHASHAKATKLTTSSRKKTQKLVDKGSTKTKGLVKKLLKADAAAELLAAQLFGYRSKSSKKLQQELILPFVEVPDGGGGGK